MVLHQMNTVHGYRDYPPIIGSTPIFSTLPCIPNLTLLCSPVNPLSIITHSADKLCSFEYPSTLSIVGQGLYKTFKKSEEKRPHAIISVR